MKLRLTDEDWQNIRKLADEQADGKHRRFLQPNYDVIMHRVNGSRPRIEIKIYLHTDND